MLTKLRPERQGVRPRGVFELIFNEPTKYEMIPKILYTVVSSSKEKEEIIY